jgi:hypothetical protein
VDGAAFGKDSRANDGLLFAPRLIILFDGGPILDGVLFQDVEDLVQGDASADAGIYRDAMFFQQ